MNRQVAHIQVQTMAIIVAGEVLPGLLSKGSKSVQ